MFGGFGSVNDPLDLVALLIRLLAFAVLARALMSWVSPDPTNPIVRVLDTITEPILQPLRQIVPRIGMIDLTPMVAMVLLFFLSSLVGSI